MERSDWEEVKRDVTYALFFLGLVFLVSGVVTVVAGEFSWGLLSELAAVGLFWFVLWLRVRSEHQAFQALEERHAEMGLRQAVFLFEIATEFLSRFADYRFRVAGAHPEVKKNRLDAWATVVYAAAIANQIKALGDAGRAIKLRTWLMRQMNAVPVDLEDGGLWTALRSDAFKMLVPGKMPVASVSLECFEAAQATRLSDYVIDFEKRESDAGAAS